MRKKPKDLSACESEERGRGEGGGVYAADVRGRPSRWRHAFHISWVLQINVYFIFSRIKRAKAEDEKCHTKTMKSRNSR